MALCGMFAGMFLFAACAWATGYRQGVDACDEIGRTKAIFVVPTETKWMLAAAALLGLGAIALK